MLRDENRDGYPEGPLVTLLSGLDTPNGVAWHNGDLYVAGVSTVYKIEGVDAKVLDGTFDQVCSPRSCI